MINIFTADIGSISNEAYFKEYSLISSMEKESILSRKSDIKKKQSLAGKILLRRAAFELYGKSEYTITKSENGKPLLNFCFFSISHCENMVVCAVSDKPVGVDIERLRDIKKRKKYHFFTDDEVLFLKENNNFNRDFLRIWTRKEAYLKCNDIKSEKLKLVSVLNDSDKCAFETFEKDGFIISLCKLKV